MDGSLMLSDIRRRRTVWLLELTSSLSGLQLVDARCVFYCRRTSPIRASTASNSIGLNTIRAGRLTGCLAGRDSRQSQWHGFAMSRIRNSDNILRVAGLNVPFCREYHVDFHDGLGEQTVRLARFADDAVPLVEAWRNGDERFRRKIREQAVAAYPVQAWIAGIDTFTYDNVLVDGDGNLIFADNGASFDFRACGKRKGWFWERKDVTDPRSGYLSLAAHPDQYVLKEILGQTTGEELWAAAKQYDFTALARRLPDSHRRHALMVYSKLLMAAQGKKGMKE